MKVNAKLLVEARGMAYRVSFLTTKEEVRLYYKAIYSALLWGKGDCTNTSKGGVSCLMK